MNYIEMIASAAISSGVFAVVAKFLLDRIKAIDEEQKKDKKEIEAKTIAVQLGVQALLRDRLIQSYNYYMDKGYAPIYARENFENMWQQYHDLGQNGVMDGLRRRFHELPDDRPII